MLLCEVLSMPSLNPIQLVILFAANCAIAAVCNAASPKLEFNRDVRPILSDKCFACHGQDAAQRQAELRLDVSDASPAHQKAIVPGKPDQSELIARIESHDADQLMPPSKSNKVLSDSERAILRRWIEEGAAYQKHWASYHQSKLQCLQMLIRSIGS